MLSVVFSVFASDVLGVDPVNQPFAFEQLDGVPLPLPLWHFISPFMVPMGLSEEYSTASSIESEGRVMFFIYMLCDLMIRQRYCAVLTGFVNRENNIHIFTSQLKWLNLFDLQQGWCKSMARINVQLLAGSTGPLRKDIWVVYMTIRAIVLSNHGHCRIDS